MNRDVGFGIFFVIAGAVFLLDALEVFELEGGYVWPLLLIGLGIAVIFGGRRREPAPGFAEGPPDEHPSEEHPSEEHPAEEHVHERESELGVPSEDEPPPGEPEDRDRR